MPYQYILANLLAEVDDVVGIVFVDDEGETVDVAGGPNAEVDLRLLGAYLGIYAQRAAEMVESLDLGEPRVLFVEREGMILLARALSGGYCLGLVQSTKRNLGRSARSLERAAEDLEREVLNGIES